MVAFLTDPLVITVLLTIAGVGIVLELFSPKIGVAGFIGIFALILFFYGHFLAGLAGYGTILLFLAGIVLIFLEFFLPGAISGTLGVAALILSLFLAGENAMQIGVSILIAIFFSTVVFFIMIKMFDKKLVLFSKMVLVDSARTEDGYVSNINRLELVGMEGTALTMLRPSGTVILNNERVDVVSEGGFIEQNATVKVIKVEGVRIVVRPLEK
ncbi:NfeD family protein [Neobacillus soli]|uniref:NfeD family protein n=1 Tax=Neobacillus soli TaxID=220688 RepID=UPI0008267DD7|nr:NfeD family protein [Neobacillus soli]